MSLPPILVLSKPSEILDKCTPHLMPFHISYSGPAPVKSYFLIRPAPSSVGQGRETEALKGGGVIETPRLPGVCGTGDGMDVDGPLTSVSDETQEPCNSTSSGQTTFIHTQPIATSSEPSSSTPSGQTTFSHTQPIANSAKLSHTTPPLERYIAAFRGRTVHGLKVDLPTGYTGVVLGTPDSIDGKSKGKQREPTNESKKTRCQPKRRGRKAKASSEISGNADLADQEEEERDAIPPDDARVRNLSVTHTFPSFTLWHPDIPVDEGRDEYLRMLKEWVTLSDEIHRID